MYIKLKIKSSDKLDREFPDWRESQTYREPFWAIKRFQSYHGKDITNNISSYYKNFESVPNEIIFKGYKIEKRFLEWEEGDNKPLHIISNGLMKIK